LKNRVNAIAFGFVPDVIFSVDPATKRAVTIGGVTVGIELVPNSQYQVFCNGVTAKFQVCSHSRISAALSNIDASPKVRARDTLDAHVFFCFRYQLPTFLISFLTEVLVALRYFLFGPRRIALGTRWAFNIIGTGARSLALEG
jgi:hypothetical protein